ncbi:MAG TPA: PLP-dependent aspartate aminotransferase family protein [Fimbriimonas sp.]|nr:PLP-dependent aspartate aminotransferase family protein [Fimbriimonas sp.]
MDLEHAEYGLNTMLAHYGEEEKLKGAVTPPIFQNSLFVFPTMEELLEAMYDTPAGPPHHYSRVGNPTTALAEKKIAKLEGAEACKLFGTGMGAISAAVISCVKAGSHVIAADTCYGPVRDFVSKYLDRFGVTYTWVDGRCPEEFFDAIRPETSLIYLESPSSLVFRLQDIEAVAKFARQKGIATIMDNTYNTPLHMQPLSVGVDMVVHSGTKYFGGHSDITAGAVATSNERANKMIRGEIAYFGAILHPFSAWLLNRGLRTLPLRLKRHEETANTIAAWLDDRPEIDVVHHLGLPSYPQRDLMRKMMTGTGGLFSFEPKVQDEAKVMAFANSLKLFQRGISWGGHESLVVALKCQPLGYTEERWIVRLFCGLEDAPDLIRDLDQALAHLA